MATNRAPVSSETALSQLVTGSPSALPSGTRPEATAPTTVPMKNGVSSDESPNSAWETRRSRAPGASRWKANPAPRSTIPSAARLSGMNSVEKIAAKAAEKAVQSTTSTKISQTWLDSQTGPIAQSISARARLPRSPLPGEQRPEARPEVGAAEDRVEGDADPEHAGDGVGGAHSGPRARRSRARARRWARREPRSSSDSPSRQRRAIERRTRIAATPRAV